MSELADMLIEDATSRMNGAVSALKADLAGYRTGRASPAILDRLVIEQYGVEMQLNQVATVSVPEPQQLAIRPYDASSLAAIERAIMKSDLGIMPNNDGKMIRLNIPRLTEERRRDLTKQVGKRVEEAKVATRNVRKDIQNDLRGLENDKDITEDDLELYLKDLQTLIDAKTKEIDALNKAKSEEIMEV